MEAACLITKNINDSNTETRLSSAVQNVAEPLEITQFFSRYGII